MQATYEEQWEKLLAHSRSPRYLVRIHPMPAGTWKLRPRNYEYEPTLAYWAMMQVTDKRFPEGKSTWTMWFGFRTAPFQNLDKTYHDAEAIFVAFDDAPHHVMTGGFEFDLFVDPTGPVARAEVL